MKEWWEQGEAEWTVRYDGIPFHATDCESDTGAYKDIPHEQNKATYRDLVGILAASRLGGIGVAIDLVAKKSVFPNSIAPDYYRAFQECIARAANVAENLGEIVELTFDISTENEYNAGLLYSFMRLHSQTTQEGRKLDHHIGEKRPLGPISNSHGDKLNLSAGLSPCGGKQESHAK